MFESINIDLDEWYEGQEGNITIVEHIQIDDIHVSLVSVSSGDKIIFIMGHSLKFVKKMSKSDKFK